MCLFDQEKQALERPIETHFSQALHEHMVHSALQVATYSSSSAGTLRMNRVHKSSKSSVLGCMLAVMVECVTFSRSRITVTFVASQCNSYRYRISKCALHQPGHHCRIKLGRLSWMPSRRTEGTARVCSLDPPMICSTMTTCGLMSTRRSTYNIVAAFSDQANAVAL